MENIDKLLIEAWNKPEKLPEIREWLKIERDEAACSQYASIVLKKYLERENLPNEYVNKFAELWSIFSWQLYLSVGSFVKEGIHTEMLRSLFAELVELSELAFPDFFAYRLKTLLEKIFNITEENDKIKLLLPQKAVEQIGEIKRMIIDEYEWELERQSQMGY